MNATDARIALDSLAAVGVRLPAGIDLNKRLTEADVTTISRLAGLRVSSSNPTDSFDSEEVERFFLAFGSELGSEDDGDFGTRNGETPGGESGSADGEARSSRQ